MCEYALITLNMNEYANIYLKKTNKQTKKAIITVNEMQLIAVIFSLMKLRRWQVEQ